MRSAPHFLAPSVRRLFALICYLWSAMPQSGAAQGAAPPVVRGPALHWVRGPAAEQCETPAEIAQHVEARLQREVFVQPAHALLTVEGLVTRTRSGGYVVHLRLTDPDGSVFGARELRSSAGEPCTTATAMAELIIALSLRGNAIAGGIALPPAISAALDELFAEDPSLAPSVPRALPRQGPSAAPPQQRTAITGATAATATTAAPSTVTKAPPSARAFGLQLGLGASLVTGLQPGRASLGPALHFATVSAGPLLGLSAQWLLPHETPAPASASGGMRSEYLRFSVAICNAPAQALLPRLRVAACAVVGAGRMLAKGVDFDARDGRAVSWFGHVAPGALAQLQLVGALNLAARLQVPLRLGPPQVAYIDSSGETRRLFAVPQVGVTADLSLTYSLF